MTYKKRNFALEEIRRFVEPGPIVLVTWKDESNIMTMGWHTMMSFEPALVFMIAGKSISYRQRFLPQNL